MLSGPGEIRILMLIATEAGDTLGSNELLTTFSTLEGKPFGGNIAGSLWANIKAADIESHLKGTQQML